MSEIHPVYSSYEVLNFTAEMTRYVIDNKIKGDLIECGVAAGSQIAMMQKTQLELNEKRTIWGFDSFCGIPYATEHDATQPAIGEIDRDKLGLLETTGVSSHSKESVMENFNRWNQPIDNVRLIEGWFEDTIQPTSKQIKQIALLRLDGDLYRSTHVCMKHLYKKLAKGGVLIIDDYQLDGCAKAIHEFIAPDKIKHIHNIAYYIKS